MTGLLERLLPTLGRKIALAVAVVLLVFGGAFVFIAHRTGYSMLEEQAAQRALSISEFMEMMIEHAMVEGQPAHARHALEVAAATSFIKNAYILDNEGNILSSARTADGVSSLPLARFHPLPGIRGETYESRREGDTLYEYIALPIVKKESCYRCHHENVTNQGYFTLKLSLDDLPAVASKHRLANIVMTVLVFGGLGGILYIALSVLVIRPIRNLHSHIQTVQKGMGELERGARVLFPLALAPQGSDEIAGLRRDFNSLVERLNDAYARLFELHHTQLEHADRLATTGQMAASMAHEIKNPIAGVLGALQVFESEMAREDPKKEIMAEMKIQLERVNHAVNDLLAYARPTPPVFGEVDVRNLIERTLTLLKQQLKGSSISVETNLDGRPMVLMADRKQLQQVLWNVMLNGIQAMDGGGTLTVAAQEVNAHVDILVEDTGRGIAPDQLGRVFEPFFTTKHKGTGLGMTISRRIVEQHGGQIYVVSEPGKGTAVAIMIPVTRSGG